MLIIKIGENFRKRVPTTTTTTTLMMKDDEEEKNKDEIKF